MKRLLSITLVLLCLLLSTTAMAITEEEIVENMDASMPSYEQMLYVCGKLEYFDSETMNPPRLTLVPDGDRYRIDCEYTPEYYISYFYNNRFHKITDETTQLQIKIRFDDGEWVSSLYGPLGEMFTPTINFDSIPTAPQTFTILKCAPVRDDFEDVSDAPYHDIIEERNGYYYIDFTKHTMEVQLSILHYFDENPYTMPVTRTTKLMQLTTETLPTNLPIPVVDRASVSTKENTLSFRVAPDATVDALVRLGHECYVLCRYNFNDKPSQKTTRIAYPTSTYTIVDLPKLKYTDDGKDVFISEYAFFDATTNITSEWVTVETGIREEQDALIQSPHISEPEPTESKCNLCKAACGHPLGMCIWLFIPVCIFGCSTIISGCWIMIGAITRRKNTCKEKSTCPSKNSKTPK